MATPEILAPVGGQEQLLAAVRCGAEAVYLGASGFNARRNAANFDDAALAQAARYCRTHGVKLYVTVNTLVTDSELPALEKTADAIAQAGADGVILQDMASLRLFAGRYPAIHRVASTQTAVHNVDGAKFLQDAGFDSFVLARELSLQEMETICAAVDIPAEAFVHGAHCMSVSGACCLSAMLGGRSGNRGLCAQPCRLDWRCGDKHHALSLKDMSLIRHIQALADVGVATLKIEGRMKRPEYVAAAVTACKNAREGKPFDEAALAAVFSRSGFTDGYLMDKRDRDMFGARTKEDVTGAASVLPSLAALYRKETPLVPVDMRFAITENGSAINVSDGQHALTLDGPAPEPAVNRPLDEERVRESLFKTGGTQYYVNSHKIYLTPGMTLPVSAVNALRRDALAALDEARGQAPEIPREDFAFPALPVREQPTPSPLWGRFARGSQIAGTERLERIILPLSEIDEKLIAQYGPKLTAELPALVFPGDEAAMKASLLSLKEAGLQGVWADNIYGIRLGKRLGLGVRGGFGLNALNSQTVEFYREQGLLSVTVSFELPMDKLRHLRGHMPWGVVAYGRLPLMRFRNCPVRASIGCGQCGSCGQLTDRKDIAFPVECGGKKYATLLNSVPLHIAGRDDPGGHRLLYFTREDAAQCETVIDEFFHDRTSPLPRTGGLYYRKLM